MQRIAGIVSLVLLGSLVIAAPVAAARPLVETFVIEDTFPIPCGDYDAVQDFTVTIRVKTWFDGEGNPTHVIANFLWDGTLTNSVTGFSIRDHAAWTEFVDLTTGEFRQAGLIWSLSVPGEGIVALDAGSITLHPDGSVTIHGPHQVFEAGDALVCAAVA